MRIHYLPEIAVLATALALSACMAIVGDDDMASASASEQGTVSLTGNWFASPL